MHAYVGFYFYERSAEISPKSLNNWAEDLTYDHLCSLKLLNLLDILEIHSQISRQKEFSNKAKVERLEIQLDYSLTG